MHCGVPLAAPMIAYLEQVIVWLIQLWFRFWQLEATIGKAATMSECSKLRKLNVVGVRTNNALCVDF